MLFVLSLFWYPLSSIYRHSIQLNFIYLFNIHVYNILMKYWHPAMGTLKHFIQFFCASVRIVDRRVKYNPQYHMRGFKCVHITKEKKYCLEPLLCCFRFYADVPTQFAPKLKYWITNTFFGIGTSGEASNKVRNKFNKPHHSPYQAIILKLL